MRLRRAAEPRFAPVVAQAARPWTTVGVTPSQLRRQTPSLDGFRGAAALFVFLFHYGGGLRSPLWPVRLLGSVAAAGWSGVTALFVLSGFLITVSLVRSNGSPATELPRGSLRGFYARRLRRIVPLYLAAMAAAAVCALATGASRAQLAALLPYAGFVQNLPGLVRLADHAPGPLPLFHLWSVAVEMQFYLVWPPLLLWAERRGAPLELCLAALAASLLFRGLAYGHGLPGNTAELAASLPLHLGSFALGAAVAALLPTRRWPAVLRLAPWGVVAGTSLFLLATRFGGTMLLASPAQFILGLTGLGLAAASLLALALQPGPVARLLSSRPLRWVGRVSYGLYVFHVLLRPWVDRIGEQLSHATTVLLSRPRVCWSRCPCRSRLPGSRTGSWSRPGWVRTASRSCRPPRAAARHLAKRRQVMQNEVATWKAFQHLRVR